MSHTVHIRLHNTGATALSAVPYSTMHTALHEHHHSCTAVQPYSGPSPSKGSSSTGSSGACCDAAAGAGAAGAAAAGVAAAGAPAPDAACLDPAPAPAPSTGPQGPLAAPLPRAPPAEAPGDSAEAVAEVVVWDTKPSAAGTSAGLT